MAQTLTQELQEYRALGTPEQIRKSLTVDQKRIKDLQQLLHQANRRARKYGRRLGQAQRGEGENV